MSDFIVSARKYRPATFSSVVGQKHITSTLKNAIERGQLAHAYLFCGPRGVGKTNSLSVSLRQLGNQTFSHILDSRLGNDTLDLTIHFFSF